MKNVASGPQGATGPIGYRGATGTFMPIATGALMPMSGPIGPSGVTGPMGGIPIVKKEYPGPDGKMVASLDTEQGVVEIRSKASCQVTWSVLLEADIILSLRGHDGVLSQLYRWGTKDVYERSPEAFAEGAASALVSKGIASISREELSALFVVAKKEAFRSVSILAAELHVGHMSREEMERIWEDANAFSVMTG